MKHLKSKAVKFLAENGFKQMAKDTKAATTVNQIVANVEYASKVIYNNSTSEKKEDFKATAEHFIKTASIFA